MQTDAIEYTLTKEGIVILSIPPRAAEAENPILIYDKKSQGRIYWTSNDVLNLIDIPEAVGSDLLKSSFIYIIEFDSETETILKDYKIPIKFLDKLPPVPTSAP